MYFIRVYYMDHFKNYKGFIFHVNRKSINKIFHLLVCSHSIQEKAALLAFYLR
ncbi:hypothetical protein SAMN03080603_00331 [Acetomicrobium thermoterrenum DSM 13490]|uniref:Uncharacterized protein n=1 Tax=Acetomicrobium thermoterrenum DSM 13490 TaxID=1120987 RepID=A0A1H3DZM5_9BACT|nr:hypothetical protein SAMN03080603_00331 [Acetomicrobium thermoterrenum DSM 13490]